MKSSIKPSNYLTRCFLLVLLFGFISLGAIGGCNNGNGNGNLGLTSATRNITFINNCDITVWVGAITNTISGGWEMPESPCSSPSDCSITCTNAEAAGISGAMCSCNSNSKCEIMLDYPTEPAVAPGVSILSGRFWPRTGCIFDDTCPSTATSPFNCCDTGGCTVNKAGDFGLQCTGSGISPTTVAEFTLQSGDNSNDFYDVSLIDGFNVSVEMKSDESSSPPSGFDTRFWCGNPGGITPITKLPGCTRYGV